MLSSLWREPYLTKARQAEAVQKQQPLMRGEGGDNGHPGAAVGGVNRSRQSKKPKQPPKGPIVPASEFLPMVWRHSRQNCPAKVAECKKYE